MKIASLLTVGLARPRSSKLSFLLAIPLLLGSAAVSTPSNADAPFTFDNTGSLNTARY